MRALVHRAAMLLGAPVFALWLEEVGEECVACRDHPAASAALLPCPCLPTAAPTAELEPLAAGGAVAQTDEQDMGMSYEVGAGCGVGWVWAGLAWLTAFHHP